MDNPDKTINRLVIIVLCAWVIAFGLSIYVLTSTIQTVTRLVFEVHSLTVDTQDMQNQIRQMKKEVEK